jgi:hypothetical protein
MKIKKKGQKISYIFADAGCLGRTCFQPGMFQHRGATLSGSRNTGSPDSACCMRRAYHGCPSGPVGEMQVECDCPGKPHDFHTVSGLPLIDLELVKIRKKDGWKSA